MSDLSAESVKRLAGFRGNLCDNSTANQNRSHSESSENLILSGWPSKAADLPEELRPYYTYRDELAVLDGVIYKGSRLVFPIMMKPDILEKLHSSHQGTAPTIRRARNAVFWLQMAEIYQSNPYNLVRPMCHDIPTMAWSKIGMDIFTYKNKKYLIFDACYSDFFECEPLSDLRSRSVVKACKKTFAKCGFPHKIHSSNGTQFTSAQFTDFDNV